MEEQESPMSPEEAGQLGGEAVLEEYGPGFYKHIGKKGGETVKEMYGPEYYSEIGKKGGEAVLKKYGTEFYSEISQQRSENDESNFPSDPEFSELQDTASAGAYEGEDSYQTDYDFQQADNYQQQPRNAYDDMSGAEDGTPTNSGRTISELINELNEIVRQITQLSTLQQR